MGPVSCLVTDILQNIFLCVQQNKEIHDDWIFILNWTILNVWIFHTILPTVLYFHHYHEHHSHHMNYLNHIKPSCMHKTQHWTPAVMSCVRRLCGTDAIVWFQQSLFLFVLLCSCVWSHFITLHYRPLVTLKGLRHLEGRNAIKYFLIILLMRLSDVTCSNNITGTIFL